MKLQYLGTGGGGGLPEIFCGCRVCRNAREHGGKELRARPLAVIDDVLCIDLPCDARESFLRHRVDAGRLRWLLVTHSHYDHFLPENLLTRPEGAKPLEVYISRGSGQALEEQCQKLKHSTTPPGIPSLNLPRVHFVEAFREVELPGYRVVALPADHAKELEALNYIIIGENSTALWLHDTGPLLEETKDYLRQRQLRFDLVSMDCALPLGTTGGGHMNLVQCGETADWLRNIGTADHQTRFYLSHISHLVGCAHGELSEQAGRLGFSVAFDGEEILF